MLGLVVLSVFLGVSSFAVGILPLSFVFSKSSLNLLSHLGTGLLLGTALGIIIPEGVETLASAHTLSDDLPTTRIALSLLSGFTFMLVIEQLISPHSHSRSADLPMSYVKTSALPTSEDTVEFDAELGALESEQGGFSRGMTPPPLAILTPEEEARVVKERAYPLTFGLVLHALTDGLALGVSFFTSPDTGRNLSFIVFLAILVHKAPTALALTSSHLANSLPRIDCKRHLAAFSASTPFSAITTYLVLGFLGTRNEETVIGTFLLISGGTFLYVATVLQPVSHDPESDNNVTRVLLIVLGIFVPFFLASLLGHGH